jgi:hypothetical protein
MIEAFPNLLFLNLLYLGRSSMPAVLGIDLPHPPVYRGFPQRGAGGGIAEILDQTVYGSGSNGWRVRPAVFVSLLERLQRRERK